MKKRLATYPLRLPASLKAAVAAVARRDGASINQFVTVASAQVALAASPRQTTG